ncbi:MAG: phosphoenolpyruvate carboxykinase (ATP), partial [Pseudomonadota bacterium]|nr:phosphoenolpyruvate carboxykinase (ATP) [Pseudomonadota bacterium]
RHAMPELTSLDISGAVADEALRLVGEALLSRTASKLVQLFVDNFEPFAAHVDQGVRDAAPNRSVAA